MLRLIFTFYLIVATIAGPHICCTTASAASLLPTLPTSRPEHHPCCPEEPADKAPAPETPGVPCPSEEGTTSTILFVAERYEVAPAVELQFVADLPLPSPTTNDSELWTHNPAFAFLYGTDLLHLCMRLTC